MNAVDSATVVAGIVAVLAVIGPLQGFLKRTLGRRWDVYRRLHRLGAGAQLSFFVSVIGEPPALRDTREVEMPDWSARVDDEEEPPTVARRFIRSTFVDPLFYLVTISDEDDGVVGFSITTRTRRFAPTFYAPRAPSTWARILERLTLGRRRSYWLVRFRLGRTTFASAAPKDWGVPHVEAVFGARVQFYSEAWYLGNPGHYLTYVFTNSTASPVGGVPQGLETIRWHEQDAAFTTDASGDPRFRPWAASIRSKYAVNTVSIISFPLTVEHWPGAFGPHGDEVRQLP